MAESQKTGPVNIPGRERLKQAEPTKFDQQIAQLQQMKLGGFKLLETSITGVDNLNPERRAKRKIFLEEEDRAIDRQQLKERLELWRDILKMDAPVTDMIEETNNRYEQAEDLFNQNLGTAVSEVRELESSYRGIDQFFNNAEVAGFKIRNIIFLNAELEQLDPADTFNNQTIEYIKEQLNQVYNRFDLRDSYSLMLVPGYLGSKMAIDTWAKIASDHKLMLLTDYRDMDTLKDTIYEFEREKIASDEGRYSNIMMTCNAIVGRGKYDDLFEEEDLYVPASTAVAGKVHKNIISQVSAGLKYGALEQVAGVKFDLLKTEVGELETLGLVPLTKEFGKVIPFSGKTLYNGSNIGLKTYSVVRVFDWLMKVFVHFLNKRAMENWSGKVEKELTDEIVQFLDKIRGPGKIIDKFEAPKFRQDPSQLDRIFVDINITPFFPAKTFIVNLTGERGRDDETGRRKDFQSQMRQSD